MSQQRWREINHSITLLALLPSPALTRQGERGHLSTISFIIYHSHYNVSCPHLEVAFCTAFSSEATMADE